MKDLDYGVGVVLSKCKRIQSVFVENTEITEDITINSSMLMLPASIYTKTAGTATSSVIGLGFASKQTKVRA